MIFLKQSKVGYIIKNYKILKLKKQYNQKDSKVKIPSKIRITWVITEKFTEYYIKQDFPFNFTIIWRNGEFEIFGSTLSLTKFFFEIHSYRKLPHCSNNP